MYANTSRYRNLLNQYSALSGNVVPKSMLETIIAKEMEQDYIQDYKRKVLAFNREKAMRDADLYRYKTDISHQDRQDELDSQETSNMFGTVSNLAGLGLALYGGNNGKDPYRIYRSAMGRY